MRKPNTRIQGKAATATRPTQAPTEAKTANGIDHNSTRVPTALVLQSNGNDERLDFPEELANQISFVTEQTGVPLSDFIEQAVREKYGRESQRAGEIYHRRRDREMASPVAWEFSGFGCLSLTDHEVLDYVCQVIVANERQMELLSAREINSGEQGRRYSGMLLHDAIVAARAVAQRVRVQGLKATPRNGEHESVTLKEREPLWLDLPGIKGRRPWSDERLASWVCDALHWLGDEIREQVYPSAANELELAEALWLAEEMADRGGSERKSKQAEKSVESHHATAALLNLAAA